MARIKDIAELAGVSRGTVDRVLNNRSGVSPQTAEKIKEIAKALDYRPNKAGLALAAQKKKNKIGIVLFSRNNPFFDEVSEGVQAKARELADYGVTTLTRRVEFDLAAQLAAIDELLDEGIHGLLLAPYNHPAIQEKIDEIFTKAYLFRKPQVKTCQYHNDSNLIGAYYTYCQLFQKGGEKL